MFCDLTRSGEEASVKVMLSLIMTDDLSKILHHRFNNAIRLTLWY